MRLSLVLPIHNEEDVLLGVFSNAYGVLSSITDDFEIILVNDGSSDSSSDIVDHLANQHCEVVSIHHSENRGSGAAIRSGFSAACFPYVGYMDADGQFLAEDLQRLIDRLGQLDAVVGYRQTRADPPLRVLLGKVWTILVRRLFNLSITDLNCGMKVFRAHAVQPLTIDSNGACFNAELFLKLECQGLRWREVAVEHCPRHFGGSRALSPTRAVAGVVELFALWFRYMRSGCPGLLDDTTS